MTVYVLMRKSFETRRSCAVVNGSIKGVFASELSAREEIPHWANEVRTDMINREVFASGAENIEFVVEKWEVSG